MLYIEIFSPRAHRAPLARTPNAALTNAGGWVLHTRISSPTSPLFPFSIPSLTPLRPRGARDSSPVSSLLVSQAHNSYRDAPFRATGQRRKEGDSSIFSLANSQAQPSLAGPQLFAKRAALLLRTPRLDMSLCTSFGNRRSPPRAASKSLLEKGEGKSAARGLCVALTSPSPRFMLPLVFKAFVPRRRPFQATAFVPRQKAISGHSFRPQTKGHFRPQLSSPDKRPFQATAFVPKQSLLLVPCCTWREEQSDPFLAQLLLCLPTKPGARSQSSRPSP